MLKTLAVLTLGSAFMVGCGAGKDESAAQTEEPSPAAESPEYVPQDEATPADTTDAAPSDEPAMSDTLPTAEEPPPLEPEPPPGR